MPAGGPPADGCAHETKIGFYKRFHIQGMNGVRRQIEVAAIPILGLQDEFLGAAALFWEIE
jgi:hypothetical protein